MILIKDVLHRMKTKNNQDTVKVSQELTAKIKADLKMTDEKVNVKKFLHTVVDDYIMLTRWPATNCIKQANHAWIIYTGKDPEFPFFDWI